MEINPRLIIGLGNPGKKYAKTYHNVGFLAADYLSKSQAADAKYRVLKSVVYMNQSGLFVTKALKKTGIKPKEILIAHDDSDIELGKYKFSFGRGSAGHKGVESIIQSLGTKSFWRLRIGIRKITKKKADEFVLKKITKKDLKTLEWVFGEVLNSFDKNPE